MRRLRRNWPLAYLAGTLAIAAALFLLTSEASRFTGDIFYERYDGRSFFCPAIFLPAFSSAVVILIGFFTLIVIWLALRQQRHAATRTVSMRYALIVLFLATILAVVSGLVLNFVPKPERAAAEMRRVVAPGGTVGAYVWDYAKGMRFLREVDSSAVFINASTRLNDGFQFGHILIRDAAYAGTTKEVRADLHERFADWLERRAADRPAEFEEVVGYHLEQAHRYRSELGFVDEPGRGLARHAAERLGSAGRRAFDRYDMPAAVSLLSRATALLEEGDQYRLELLVPLAEALGEAGAAR